MSERRSYSEDICTCGHPVSKHHDGGGRCSSCDTDRSYEKGKPPCLRFQWDGEPRRRTW